LQPIPKPPRHRDVAADGIERRLAYRRLAEYPIYVCAGLATSAIRERWFSTMSQHLIFGAPATALLFSLLALALRRTRNLYFEADRRQEAEDALKHGQRLRRWGSSPAASRTTSTICSR